jgi:hypothetical protein
MPLQPTAPLALDRARTVGARLRSRGKIVNAWDGVERPKSDATTRATPASADERFSETAPESGASPSSFAHSFCPLLSTPSGLALAKPSVGHSDGVVPSSLF